MSIQHNYQTLQVLMDLIVNTLYTSYLYDITILNRPQIIIRTQIHTLGVHALAYVRRFHTVKNRPPLYIDIPYVYIALWWFMKVHYLYTNLIISARGFIVMLLYMVVVCLMSYLLSTNLKLICTYYLFLQTSLYTASTSLLLYHARSPTSVTPPSLGG